MVIPTPTFGTSAEAYGPIQAATPCAEGEATRPARPGPLAFGAFLVYHVGGKMGRVSTTCTVGSTSFHIDGRALDWMISTPTQAADAWWVIDNWLMKDRTVNGVVVADEYLKRLGIVEMIFNGRIWTTSTKVWKDYKARVGTSNVFYDCRDYPENPDRTKAGWSTECHYDHVHFSFSIAGADQTTSWWKIPRANLRVSTWLATPVVSASSIRVKTRTANAIPGIVGATVLPTTVSTTTKYYLSTDRTKSSGDVLLQGYHSVPALAASGATSYNNGDVFALRPAITGQYYVIACADTGNAVNEVISEADNCLATTAKIAI